jgi:hypothetical protein
MPAFTNASNVRAYAGIDAINAQQDRWNEGSLGSNIRAASAFLQKRTGRQFELQLATTKTFTTNGEAFMALPGMRNNSPTITLAGSALTVGTDAYLIPDTQQTGLYIGVQFRPFGRGSDYRSWPTWFDTNLDRRWYPGFTSDPNDLSVRDDWGFINYPEELIHATNVLSAWFTRRPDSLLGGVSVTQAGTEVDMGALPVEVRLFIEEWKIGNAVVAVG